MGVTTFQKELKAFKLIDPTERSGLQTLQKRLPTFAGPDGLVKYVVVHLDVARENHEKFQGAMIQLTDRMYSFKKWELVFAAYPITGVVNRFLHIWKIPSEDTVIQIMREGALAPDTTRLALDPDDLADQFRIAYQVVQDMIIRTEHTLMTSLSYDPENVGYQTQTILIDAAEKAYIIDHGALRGQTNVKRIKRLADPSVARGKKVDLNKEDTRLNDIKNLLNRGITDATIDGKELLFNLAGLRPKTIFENLESIAEAGKPAVGAAAPTKAKLPAYVSQLLLAMPDGNVFEVDGKALEDIARPLDMSERIKNLVGIFIRDRIPMASLPNDRQEIVGDGCACYVINLASFKTKP